jgi:hypothetical protein
MTTSNGCRAPPISGGGAIECCCDAISATSLRSADCVSTVSIVSGFLQTRLSVAVVVADGADRADGVFEKALISMSLYGCT